MIRTHHARGQRPWFNIYEDGEGQRYVIGPYQSRRDADQGAGDRLGCHQIELRSEFQEGSK